MKLIDALTKGSVLWDHRHGIIEQALRQRLAQLDPNAPPIGTADLLAPLQDGLDKIQTGELISRVVALGKNLPSLTAGKGTRQKYGKTFPTYLWAHVPYVEPERDVSGISQVRVGDVAASLSSTARFRRQESSGPAGQGASLAKEVDALNAAIRDMSEWRAQVDAWIAARDPLFRVL